MNYSDGISVLTFQDVEQQGEFCVNGPPTKRYCCKYESCAKSFIHTSSLYRHHRLRHLGGLLKKEDLNNTSSTDSYDTDLYVETSLAEEIQKLELQMISAGQGPLFAQFYNLLEGVPHADKATLGHLKAFHQLLHKALLEATSPVRKGKRAHSSSSVPHAHRSLLLPTTSLSLLTDQFGPARVEFSDEGENSPYKRANCASDVFDMYRTSGTTQASPNDRPCNTVTPREYFLPQGDESTQMNGNIFEQATSSTHGEKVVNTAASARGSSRHDVDVAGRTHAPMKNKNSRREQRTKQEPFHRGRSIFANMGDRDAMSEISLTEMNADADIFAMCEPIGKKFCCPKVYAHSSSMYRHIRSAHTGDIIHDAANLAQTQSVTGSEQSTFGHSQKVIGPNPALGVYQHNEGSGYNPDSFFMGSTQEAPHYHNGSIEDDIHELHQHMTFGGHDALFAQFSALLESVPHSNEASFEFWVAFASLLRNSLPPHIR